MARQAMMSNGHAKLAVAPRGLMKDHAYQELKARLLSGDYAPGSFLSERRLAADLRMSKTPIKAALERLEAEGFVAVSPQQGIVVRELAIHEINDLYEIRAALEAYVLHTMAGRLTPEQVAAVRANLKAQAKLRGSGDVSRGVELDAQFHIQFAEFLGNREILRVIGQLREKMQRVVTQIFRVMPGRIDTSHDEHSAIAAAVISGDGAKAADLIAIHLEMGKRLILSPRA